MQRGKPDHGCPEHYGTQALIAANLPVDHFVLRANAWITGADTWPDCTTAITGTQGRARRTTQGQQMLSDFANDLSGAELLIVESSPNSAKQDSGPQDWMPVNQGMYCAYAKMWIEVKWEWNLAVNHTTAGTGPSNTNAAPEQQYLQYLLNTSC
jgi:hypothetical protein